MSYVPYSSSASSSSSSGSSANRAVLIGDWSWIHKCSKGSKIDWLALVTALERKYNLHFVYKGVFGSTALHCDKSDPKQWLNESTTMFLQRANFHVESFANKRQRCDCGKETEVQSGSVDAAISVCIFENVILRQATHLVLLAGDGDFAFIVDWMKKQRSSPTFILAAPFKNESVSAKLISHTDHENNVFEFGHLPELWLHGKTPVRSEKPFKSDFRPEQKCEKFDFKEKPRFHCDVCQISCNSLQQLQNHLEGKVHRERLTVSDENSFSDSSRVSSPVSVSSAASPCSSPSPVLHETSVLSGFSVSGSVSPSMSSMPPSMSSIPPSMSSIPPSMPSMPPSMPSMPPSMSSMPPSMPSMPPSMPYMPPSMPSFSSFPMPSPFMPFGPVDPMFHAQFAYAHLLYQNMHLSQMHVNDQAKQE
jgi:hypothetical protein